MSKHINNIERKIKIISNSLNKNDLKTLVTKNMKKLF